MTMAKTCPRVSANPAWMIALPAAAFLTGCSGLGPRMIIDPPAQATPGPAAAAPAPAPAPTPGAAAATRPGGYYKDDGPGENPPDLAAIREPEPRVEPLHRFANRPYNVFGVSYTPQTSLQPWRERGLGSWYGRKFHGQKTSSGEIYDMYGMTAAHPTLPIPSYARVTNVGNGRSVIVRVNDRGPFHPGRIIDLSYTAAWKLGYVNAGSTPVEVESFTPELIAAHAASRRSPTAVAQARPAAPAAVATAATAAAAKPPATTTVTALAAVPPPEAQAIAAPVAPVVAVATPAGPAQTLPVEVRPGGVFLQLAAFSARDNAEAFRARLSRQLGSLADGIEIFQRDGLFRLHVGPYRDRGEAGGIAERLRSELQLSPMIVVR